MVVAFGKETLKRKSGPPPTWRGRLDRLRQLNTEEIAEDIRKVQLGPPLPIYNNSSRIRREAIAEYRPKKSRGKGRQKQAGAKKRQKKEHPCRKD